MKRVLPIALFVLFVGLVAAGGLFVSSLVQQPLDEPLEIEVAEPEPAAALKEPGAAKNVAQKPGVCGQQGSRLILFAGEDSSGGVWPLGADAIRLVKADFDTPRITVIAFPRDLWVQTPALAAQEIAETRLGLAYHLKKETTQGSEKHRVTAATVLVAQTLYDNFGVEVENYFTLQLDSVAGMIDAIGGVPVDLPEAFTSDHGMEFPAGPQTLDGRAAYEFNRTFEPGGDAARRARQDLFAQALQKQVLNVGLLPRVPDLYKQFDKAIVTDLSPKLIRDLACLSTEVPEDGMRFFAVDGALVTERDVAETVPVLVPDVEAVKARLADWLE